MKRIVLTAIYGAVLLVAAILVAVSAFGGEPASGFDGGGASGMVSDAREQGFEVRRIVTGPSALTSDTRLDPENLLYVVPIAPRPFTQVEQEQVHDLLEAGATVLVLDDFGRGDSITAPYGIHFERVRLVVTEPDGVRATIGNQQYGLSVGNGTALRFTADANATVAARAPDHSFLDRDGDYFVDADDPSGAFPVVAHTTVGDGTLWVASAPALLDGRDAGDNQRWRLAILGETLPEGGTVLIDESRTTSGDPLVWLLTSATRVAAGPVRWILVASAVVLVAALAFPITAQHWHKHRFRPLRYISRQEVVARQDAVWHEGGKASWTERGAVAILGGGALALTVLVTGSVAAGAAAALLLSLALAATLIHPPRLRLERRMEAKQVPEQSTVEVGLMLEALHAGQVVQVRDELPDTFKLLQGENWFQVHLPAHRPVEITYTVEPVLRGPHRVGPLRVRSRDALGLRVEHDELDPGRELQVTPLRESVQRLPFDTKVPTITMGPHMVNRAGDGSEFLALRDYTEGDSMRIVNWKASARSRKLVVNQKVHESQTLLTVILDARAVAGAGPATETPLAHGARVVNAIATSAVQARDRLRVLYYGDGVHEMPPAPGPRQLHNLNELLASLPAEGETTFAEAVEVAAPGIKSGMPVLIVSGLEGDPTLSEGIKTIRARQAIPVVVASPISTAPPEGEDGEPEPDAEAIEQQRQHIMQEMRSNGAILYEAQPGVPLDDLFRIGGGAR